MIFRHVAVTTVVKYQKTVLQEDYVLLWAREMTFYI